MRHSALLILGVSTVALAAPVTSQAAPTRTEADFVCELTGVCGAAQAATGEAIDAPETKGFSLGRKSSAPGADERAAPQTKAFSVGRKTSGSTSASSSTTRSLPVAGRPVATPARAANRVASRRAATPAPTDRFALGRTNLRLEFLLGSAQLTSQAREEAKVFARSLQLPALASKRFRIEGHTDASGVRATNVALSERRASAVADFLATQGVARDRLDVRGVGPDEPLPGRRATDPNNRRVEAQVL